MKKIIAFVLVLLLLCSLSFPILAYSGNGAIYVYVTNTGYAYHVESCSYLRSKNRICLEDAVREGYVPCSRCNPPIYTGNISSGETKKRENNSGGSSKWSPNSKNDGSGYGHIVTTRRQPETEPATTAAAEPTDVQEVTKPRNSESGARKVVLFVLVVPPSLVFLILACARVCERSKRHR